MTELVMANNNAATQDDDSHVELIYDVLDVIFRNLSVKTLRTAALVSRSWNEVAKRELSKRTRLQSVLLPVLYNEEKPKINFGDYFKCKPNTLLMFCGPRSIKRSSLEVEYKIMKEYHRRLPARIIIVSVDYAMSGGTEIFSCNRQGFATPDKTFPYNAIIALNLPDIPDLTIKVAQCVSHEEDTEKKAAKIMAQLHDSADQLENPIYLLFNRENYSIGSHVIRNLQEKYGNAPMNVWGGTTGDFIKRSDDGYPDYIGTHGFLGILLHSPRLKAHCFVLPISDYGTMTTKLTDFRHTLKLKRHSVGLVCGPQERVKYEGNSDDWYFYHYCPILMKLFYDVFPTINFKGIFSGLNDYYGCDHTNKDRDYPIVHTKALSIMILTYE